MQAMKARQSLFSQLKDEIAQERKKREVLESKLEDTVRQLYFEGKILLGNVLECMRERSGVMEPRQVGSWNDWRKLLENLMGEMQNYEGKTGVDRLVQLQKLFQRLNKTPLPIIRNKHACSAGIVQEEDFSGVDEIPKDVENGTINESLKTNEMQPKSKETLVSLVNKAPNPSENLPTPTPPDKPRTNTSLKEKRNMKKDLAAKQTTQENCGIGMLPIPENPMIALQQVVKTSQEKEKTNNESISEKSSSSTGRQLRSKATTITVKCQSDSRKVAPFRIRVPKTETKGSSKIKDGSRARKAAKKLKKLSESESGNEIKALSDLPPEKHQDIESPPAITKAKSKSTTVQETASEESSDLIELPNNEANGSQEEIKSKNPRVPADPFNNTLDTPPSKSKPLLRRHNLKTIDIKYAFSPELKAPQVDSVPSRGREPEHSGISQKKGPLEKQRDPMKIQRFSESEEKSEEIQQEERSRKCRKSKSVEVEETPTTGLELLQNSHGKSSVSQKTKETSKTKAGIVSKKSAHEDEKSFSIDVQMRGLPQLTIPNQPIPQVVVTGNDGGSSGVSKVARRVEVGDSGEEKMRSHKQKKNVKNKPPLKTPPTSSKSTSKEIGSLRFRKKRKQSINDDHEGFTGKKPALTQVTPNVDLSTLPGSPVELFESHADAVDTKQMTGIPKQVVPVSPIDDLDEMTGKEKPRSKQKKKRTAAKSKSVSKEKRLQESEEKKVTVINGADPIGKADDGNGYVHERQGLNEIAPIVESETESECVAIVKCKYCSKSITISDFFGHSLECGPQN